MVNVDPAGDSLRFVLAPGKTPASVAYLHVSKIVDSVLCAFIQFRLHLFRICLFSYVYAVISTQGHMYSHIYTENEIYNQLYLCPSVTRTRKNWQKTMPH